MLNDTPLKRLVSRILLAGYSLTGFGSVPLSRGGCRSSSAAVSVPSRTLYGVLELLFKAADLAGSHAGRPVGSSDYPVVNAVRVGYYCLFVQLRTFFHLALIAHRRSMTES